VKFEIEHHFDAPVARVADLMLDPQFEASVKLPDVALPEVRAAGSEGTVTTLRLRYEYTGSLDPIARRLIGANKLTWIQEARFDRATNSGTLSIEAEADPKKLNAHATLTLRPNGLDACVRRLAGDFVVKVPIVGGSAERRILPGVLTRLDVEADALRARLGDTV
jgi:Protein of unknown function (DUF2505)